MNVDLYTKAVLTVIAASLVYLCLVGQPAPLHAQPAAARAEPQRVYIAGLIGPDGKVSTPSAAGLPVYTVPNAQFITFMGGWVGYKNGQPGVATFPAQPLPVTR